MGLELWRCHRGAAGAFPQWGHDRDRRVPASKRAAKGVPHSSSALLSRSAAPLGKARHTHEREVVLFPGRGAIEQRSFIVFGDGSENAEFSSPDAVYVSVAETAVDVPTTVGGSVPATLALTLGAPASFGPFMPGVGQRTTSRPSRRA